MILLQIDTLRLTAGSPQAGGLSSSAQVIIALVPLISVIVLGLLSFFFLLWDYKKRKLIIQQGGTPVSYNFNEKLLLLGIVSLFIGTGLIVFFSIANGFTSPLLGGIIPTMTGLGIITYYIIIHKKPG